MSYLAPNPDKPGSGLNALKLWLRSDITTPKFLLTSSGSYIDNGGRDSFCLEELHRALHLAVLEISLKLDPELEYNATEAGGDRYCVAVEWNEIMDGRDAEVKSLVDLEPNARDVAISSYGREATLEVLEEVRGEIGWLYDQARRLQCHMEVAVEMKRLKSRRRFVFRPLDRGWREERETENRLAKSSASKEVEMLDGDEEYEIGEGVERGMADAEEGDDERDEKEKRKADTAEQRQREVRKERLEQYKREADMGVEEADTDAETDMGDKEMFDSPLIGLEEAEQ